MARCSAPIARSSRRWNRLQQRLRCRIIRPLDAGGKVDYAEGVDPRELCNMRYLTVLREGISAARRPGDGPERFLPALDEYQPIGSTDTINYNSPTDKCAPPSAATSPMPSSTPGSNEKCAPSSTNTATCTPE